MIKCGNIIECIITHGCGRAVAKELSKEERLALHEFKKEVGAAGHRLYSRMSIERADRALVNVALTVIEQRMQVLSQGRGE